MKRIRSFPTVDEVLADKRRSGGVSIGRGNRLDHGARRAAIMSDDKQMTGQTIGDDNAQDPQAGSGGDDRADLPGGARAELYRRAPRR